jgi:hypothetical protein
MTLLTFYSFIYDLFLSQARIRGYSPEKKEKTKDRRTTAILE